MARIRGIKPDFFLDPDLAELGTEVRLAFIGLWCHADRLGRLEDEPKKLKVLIYPYEKYDMDSILAKLVAKPFIIRYQVNERKYIQIVNFQKHQAPHHTEKPSRIPSFDGALTVKEPLLDGERPVDTDQSKDQSKDHDGFSEAFESLWNKYPSRKGRKQAERHFNTSVKTAGDLEAIGVALNNYLTSDRVAKGYVQNGSTWFNGWRDWVEPEVKALHGGLPCDAPFPEEYK